MFSANKVLHFTTEEAYSGLAEVKGVLHVYKDRLVLEYQIKDAVFGVIKSKTKELIVPYDQLTEIQYRLKWYISSFRIHVNSMKILGEFPVSKEGFIALKIKRKHKHTAKEIESYINLRLSEIRLEKLGEDVDSFT